MPTPPRHWDLFCTVIDNFGDIGICWRLARQLVHEFGQPIRLWVDDMPSFRRICPELDPQAAVQRQQGVQIHHWNAANLQHYRPGRLVIEAFACELPERVKQAMSAATPAPLWLNLEYLSAEAWIDDCHGLPSHQGALGLDKYFFFPGFSRRSGGLICERSLAAERRHWQASPAQREAWCRQQGLPLPRAEEFWISLFSYENPALPALLHSWSQGPAPVRLLVPEGRSLASLQPLFGETPLVAGSRHQLGHLWLQVLPMADQGGFDRLLWSCDFNLVRGEDSFVRAQWAARPFLWHIYPQDEQAHLAKLEAFIERYASGWDDGAREALLALSLAFNRGEAAASVAAWRALQPHWPQWCAQARRWPQRLLAGGDLASRLVQFAEKKLECGA